MAKELILPVVLSILGSSGLFTMIQFLFNRYDKKKGIESKLDEIARDGKRTQLILMIYAHPERKEEILMIAKEYFVHLKGNWYVDDLFTTYCKDNNIEKPNWFKG